jgi:hypothetical protein
VIEKDGETLSTPPDKRAAGAGFPGPGAGPAPQCWPAGESCGACRFWQYTARHGASGGICMRYPPVAGGRGSAAFPVVYRNEWCGEVQRRDTR